MPLPIGGLAAPDSLEGAWAGRYLDAAIRGVRSAEVADKIALHLARFGDTATNGCPPWYAAKSWCGGTTSPATATATDSKDRDLGRVPSTGTDET